MPKLSTRRLNARAVKSLTPGASGKITWDATLRGLGLRCLPSGVKTYVLNYKGSDGKYHRLALGSADALSTEVAREKAKAMLQNVAAGNDPAKERRTGAGRLTFAEVAERYIAWTRSEGHRSAREVERLIRKELLPAWGNKSPGDLTAGDVLTVYDLIRERAPVLANHTLSITKRVFSWAITREIVAVNPASRVKPGREKRRERTLSPEEVRAFWNNAEKMGGGRRLIAALRLVLLTAARPGEIVAMRAEDIDEEHWYTVPAEVSKPGHPHRVFVSPLAMSILAEVGIPESGPIFNFKRHALARLLNRERGKLKIKNPFTPHDLRRTAATMMASSGTPRFVIARVLGHSDREVTGVYDRYSYDNEKRDAAIRWAARLQEIVEGKTRKIVSIA